jgi:hypothetical protein
MKNRIILFFILCNILISCEKKDILAERMLSEKIWDINNLLSNPPNAVFPVTVQVYQGTMLLHEEKTDNKTLKVIDAVLKSNTAEYDISELSQYGSDNYIGASNEKIRRSAWIYFNKKVN